jgi:diguanylate cyclase (GGDEF)-like protein/PAS domain S-box-containing protein
MGKFNKLNNNKIIIIGIAAIILWIIIAAITFDRTFIPLKNYIGKNSEVILRVSIINDDIAQIGFLIKRVIFYETYKPVHYKNDIRKYFKKLSLITNKTDVDYKNLFTLLHLKPPVKLKSIPFSNAKYFLTFVKKSYYHWEYVSKPIIKRFVKYTGVMSLKLSDRMFFKYTLDKSVLPTYEFIRKISAGFVYLVRFAAFTFIFGTIVIIVLGILVIYYLNKFFREIRKSEQRFKNMFNNSPDIHLLMDINTGKIIDANKAAEKFYGYTRKELTDMNITDIALADHEEHWKFRLDSYNRGAENLTVKIINHKLKNNEVRRVELTIAPIEIDGKEYLIDSVKDITEKILYENSLKNSVEFFRILSENIPSIVGLYREKIFYMNPFGLKILGYTEETIKELNPLDLVEAREEEKFLLSENIKRRLNGEQFESTYTLKVKKKSGETFWGEIVATTIFFENIWTGLFIIADVSGRVVNELKLLKEKDVFKELSELDGLTDIPNRRSFDAKLEDYLSNTPLKNPKFSLIMFDIDLFKEINDTFGHQAGDAVLSELASLIKENIRKDDFFARFGGEEFMIISNNIGVSGAVELAEKLRLAIETHGFPLKINVKCSFGVTACKSGDTADIIIKRADNALYKAKENGKNRVESAE